MASITKTMLINEGVTRTDSDGDISLFCASYDSAHKNFRGVVFKGEDMLFKGFPYCVEMNDQDLFDHNIEADKCRFFDSHEGTLIRVFCVDGKWYTTTNRKLDAFKSKWAAKKQTFGETFAEAVRELVFPLDEIKDDKEFLEDIYTKYLDPGKKYMFILKSTAEERIVCDVEKKTIYHVGTFNEENELDLDAKVIFNTKTVKKPVEHSFIDLDELASYIQYNMEHTKLQGILGVHPNGTHYKIFSKEYQTLFAIRDNTPSLRFRYMQLRSDNSKLKHFFHLYPEMTEEAEKIEADNYDLCFVLHKKYMAINVGKCQDVPTSEIEKKILKIIHTQFIKSRLMTTPERIDEILVNGSPSNVNKLLKERQREIDLKAAQAVEDQVVRRMEDVD